MKLPESLGSGQITIVVCVLLALGLWFIQQFSKDYDRWDNYPVELNRSHEGSPYLFKLDDIRIRQKRNGWSIAFESNRTKDTLVIGWKELNAINWNQTSITNLICSYYNVDQEKIERIEGLESITSKRDFSLKQIPVRADYRNVSIPNGFVITKGSTIVPDSVAILGTGPAIRQFDYWPVMLSDITNEIREDTDEIISKANTPRGILISPNVITIYPELEEITEKRWDVPVVLPERLKDSFEVVPHYVQLIAQIPTGGFDNDSLQMINAAVRYSGDSIAEGIQSLDITPLPSCIQHYRLSPSFVTLLKKE